MRRSRIIMLLGACAISTAPHITWADNQIFTTQADFGRSSYAPNPPYPTQTGWQGMGYYDPSANQILPYDSLGDSLTYSPSSTDSATSNGLDNFDNVSTDANFGHSWAGKSAPSGSVIIDNYQGNSEGGGYTTITIGEMVPSGGHN